MRTSVPCPKSTSHYGVREQSLAPYLSKGMSMSRAYDQACAKLCSECQARITPQQQQASTREHGVAYCQYHQRLLREIKQSRKQLA